MSSKKSLPDYTSEITAIEKRFGIKFDAEVHFCGNRQWRFDYALECCKLAIEIEGKGHQRWNNFRADMVKYNTAQTLGWVVLRFATYDLKSQLMQGMIYWFDRRPCDH